MCLEKPLAHVKVPKRYDYLLIIAVVLMGMTSLLAIYSAFPLLNADVSGTRLIIQQSMWFVIGCVVAAVILYLGNDNLFELAKLGYYILLGMLAVLFVGKLTNAYLGFNLPFITPVNGAVSWFQFPFGSFQPSEFMKVMLIIITAGVIDEHNQNKEFHSFQSDIQLFIKIIKWLAAPAVLIFIQPDKGILLVILIALAMMIACCGIRREWLFLAGGLLVAVLAVFFYLYYNHFSLLSDLFGDPYKLRRFVGWLDTENNKIGAGQQLYTALLALGSAGITGHGMQSEVVSLLEPQTDFIFAVFGQDFGLIGALFIVGLCLFLDYRLYRILIMSDQQFDKLIICGTLGMLLYQQIQNIGMVIGLLPITGITLPFISYGGSSLLSYFIIIGVVLNTSAKNTNVRKGFFL